MTGTYVPTTTYVPTHPVRRRRGRLLVVLLVLVVLATGAVLGLMFFQNRSGSHGKDVAKAAAAVNRGLALQRSGDIAGATAAYRQALKYDATNKYALYDLAVIDYAQSNVGAAEQEYQQVLAIDPKYEPALYNLAILEEGNDNQQTALSLYQRAVAANPNDPNAHFNLALMLRAINYTADGDAQMRIALRLDPKLKDPAAISPSKPAHKPSAKPTS